MKEIKLFKKQVEAWKRLKDSETNEVLYGGGARGGKSWLGNTWICLETFEKPKSAWFVGRATFSDLRKTTLATFFKVISEYEVSKYFSYNATTHEMINTLTGSIIHFGEIGWFPSDPEYDRIGSLDLTGAFIDEAQQVRVKGIDVLRGRFSVLEGDGWQTIPKSFYSCNPQKNWIFNDFVKPFDEGRLRPDRAFIPSLVTDNPHISKDYIENLKKSDKVTQERLLYGNFYYDDDPARLIEYDKILDIFTNDFVDSGERYITSDIAGRGSDKFRVYVWSGFRVIYTYSADKSLGSEIVAKIQELAKSYKVPNSNIVFDGDGIGGGVSGFIPNAHEFINNSKAKNGENYNSLKDQCYFKLSECINEGGLYIDPDCITPQEKQEIIEELEQVKRDKIDSDGKLRIVPKEKIKEKINRSPDHSDTLMMRFYFEVSAQVQSFNADFF